MILFMIHSHTVKASNGIINLEFQVDLELFELITKNILLNLIYQLLSPNSLEFHMFDVLSIKSIIPFL